jgi:hypothetical protein
MPVSQFLAIHTSRELAELYALESLDPSDVARRLELHTGHAIDWGKEYVDAYEAARVKSAAERSRILEAAAVKIDAWLR